MEDAANELINMLLDIEVHLRKENEKSVVPTREKIAGKKIVL